MTNSSPKFDRGLSVAEPAPGIQAANVSPAADSSLLNCTADHTSAAAAVLASLSEREQKYLMRYYALAHDPVAVRRELKISEREARALRARAKSLFATLTTAQKAATARARARSPRPA